MTEKAKVLELDGDTAVVQCLDHPGCDSCGSMFCNVKSRTFRARVGDGITVERGQSVDVVVPPARAIRSGFFVLILPLILFVAGYLASAPLEAEPLRVLSGLGGLVMGFLLVFAFGRSHRDDLPMIASVHDAEDFEPVRMPR